MKTRIINPRIIDNLLLVISFFTYYSTIGAQRNLDLNNPFATEKMTDERDNKQYSYFKLGDQYWFSDNLKYHSPNGICYDGDSENENCDKYGVMYPVADLKLQICPDGWKVPSKEDWLKFIYNFGGGYYDLNNEKDIGESWLTMQNLTKNNFYNQNLFNGFYASGQNKFMGLDFGGYYWSSTFKNNIQYGVSFRKNVNIQLFGQSKHSSSYYYCRCVKDIDKNVIGNDLDCLKASYPSYFRGEDKSIFTPDDIEREFYALLIVNETFSDNDLNLPKSSFWIDSLQSVLKNKYLFRKVKIEENVTHNRFQTILNSIKAGDYFNFSEPETKNILVYVLTHGAPNGEILFTDNISRSTKDIFTAFLYSKKLNDSKNILYIEDICYGSTDNSFPVEIDERKSVCNTLNKNSRIAVSSSSGQPTSNYLLTKKVIEKLNSNQKSILSIDNLYYEVQKELSSNSRLRFKIFEPDIHSGGTFFFLKKDYLTHINH